jgi:hypothetical protein
VGQALSVAHPLPWATVLARLNAPATVYPPGEVFDSDSVESDGSVGSAAQAPTKEP